MHPLIIGKELTGCCLAFSFPTPHGEANLGSRLGRETAPNLCLTAKLWRGGVFPRNWCQAYGILEATHPLHLRGPAGHETPDVLGAAASPISLKKERQGTVWHKNGELSRATEGYCISQKTCYTS